jgi:hypothetical protein
MRGVTVIMITKVPNRSLAPPVARGGQKTLQAT